MQLYKKQMKEIKVFMLLLIDIASKPESECNLALISHLTFNSKQNYNLALVFVLYFSVS